MHNFTALAGSKATPEAVKQTVDGVLDMYRSLPPENLEAYRKVFDGFGGAMIETLLEMVRYVAADMFTDAKACCLEAVKLEECMGQEESLHKRR